MKIVADENIPFINEAFASLGEVITRSGRTIKNSDLSDCKILLVRSVTQVNQQLLSGTAVRFIGSATSGINHIDSEYLQQQNIRFAHALGSNAQSVAEYVMSAIAYWSLKQNKALDQLKIGIIGCGQIGSRLAKLCQHFGINTVLNDPPLAEQKQQGKWASLAEALACDIVSLHVPLTESGNHATKNLIHHKHINDLNPGTLLINTSRGEVVDEPALLSRQKRLQDLNLVLDVWQQEPHINLELLPHLLIGTPHIAGYGYDGKIRGTEMIYQACCQFLQINPQWSANKVIEPASGLIDNCGQDPRKAILQAYDIRQDNNRLKMLLNNHEPDVSNYFDHLRKTYPIRREWSSVTL